MKKKLNLDLEVRRLTKAIIKGEYPQNCVAGKSGQCRCGQNKEKLN